jgi:hypothetical protein
VASVIKHVVASAAESELGACFENAQSGAPLRVTLTELGNIQPAPSLRSYNSTAFGILNETIKQKRSKAMDMRYHWLTDRVSKNNLTFIGDEGVKILETITQNIIQHNITKTCADLFYIRQTSLRFCEGVLNYSHSSNPTCLRAHTHIHIQALREQFTSRVCWSVCTLSQYRTLMLLLSHNFSNDMVNSTSLNEVHYCIVYV